MAVDLTAAIRAYALRDTRDLQRDPNSMVCLEHCLVESFLMPQDWDEHALWSVEWRTFALIVAEALATEEAVRAYVAALMRPKATKVYKSCAKHEGLPFTLKLGYAAPAVPVCPHCEAEAPKDGVGDPVPADYPECSGDPSSCPENEGYGCCGNHGVAVDRHQVVCTKDADGS